MSRPLQLSRTEPRNTLPLMVQRGVLVALMMGVDASWGAGPGATSHWWLEAWAARLAQERLDPDLSAQVISWVRRVGEAVTEPGHRQDQLDLLHREGRSLTRRVRLRLGQQG